MYRDTVFTIIVYPEMYRDMIFMIEIYPDMYHDTVTLCVRLGVVLVFRTHVSLPMLPLKIHCRKCSQCRNESIGRPSRVTSATAYSWEVRSSLSLSRVIDQVGNLEFSLYVQGPLSWYEGE